MSSAGSRKAMKARQKFRSRLTLNFVILFAVIIMLTVMSVGGVFAQGTGSATTPALSPERADMMKFGLLAAAIAFGLGALGAGIAIANVGAAAMGAMSEKPEIGGQALIFIALAEGLVVFGFITAIMILGRL